MNIPFRLSTLIICVISFACFAQNSTGINNLNPNPKAALDVKTTAGFKQGWLMPRLSTADTNRITNLKVVVGQDKGLMFYDTTANIIRWWDGQHWQGEGSTTSPSWQLAGNNLPDTSSQYIGTLNYTPFSMRTNNIERVHVSSNGNIGIGTSIANTNLTLAPTYHLGWRYSAGNTSVAHTIGTSAQGASPLEFKTTYNPGSTGPIFEFIQGNGGNNYVLTMLYNGNVGIGTVAPFAVLDVAGSLANNVQAILTRGNIDGNFQLYAANGTASNAAGTVQSTFGMRYAGSGDAAVISFLRGNSSLDATMTFNTNAAERMRVDDVGNVGIGTTAPNCQLHVSSMGYLVALFQSSSTAGTWTNFSNTSTGGQIFTLISTGSTNGEGAGKLLFNKSLPLGTTTGNIMTFDYATSNVGIGCTAPTAKLFVIGDIIATSTITASGLGCTSDIRYKKNIHAIQNALEIVKKIDGKTYYWRTDEFKNLQFTKAMQYGFIAQEIEKVLPSLVLTDSSASHYKSVDYSRLTPILVEAVKEQQQTIEAQNLKIKQLEQKQTDTNKELQQLKTENTGLRGDVEDIKKHLGLNVEAKR